VTLLASIACKESGNREKFYLLFPWAEGDLLAYWQKQSKLERSHEKITWTFNQFYDIVDAINYIHNPSNMFNDKGQKLYGRHGDIKPENILWYRKNGQDILVISDLGLSAVHREASRSNQIEADATPSYRPPECDIQCEDNRNIGRISRSFDIWSLGCMFIELITWMLLDYHGLEQFKSKRQSSYVKGLQMHTNAYYDVVRLDENSKYPFGFKIKDEVLKVSRPALIGKSGKNKRMAAYRNKI
jgi:serine/threonine protein kinase